MQSLVRPALFLLLTWASSSAAQVVAEKVVRQGANGVDEVATVTAELAGAGVNFKLTNESSASVTASFEATLVCANSARTVNRTITNSIKLTAAAGASKGERLSCWSLGGYGDAVDYQTGAVDFEVRAIGPTGTQGGSERPPDESNPRAREARSRGEAGGAGTQRADDADGAGQPRGEPRTGSSSSSQRSDGTPSGATRSAGQSAGTASSPQRSSASQRPPSSSSSTSSSRGGASSSSGSSLPLPTRLPLPTSAGSSSGGGGKAVGGAVLGGGALAGAVGAAAGASSTKPPSESELRYRALKDEVPKGKNQWLPPVASLGVLVAGVGLLLLLDGLSSLLSSPDETSDTQPPTSFGVLPVLFGVDGPLRGLWARPEFNFMVGVETLSYRGHYLDAAARAGGSPGLSVNGDLTGHATGGVVRWGVLRGSAFLVGAYGKLLDPLEDELEALHPGSSSDTFRSPASEAFIGADWSVGLQLWQGLLSPYLEYRNVSLKPVHRLGTMQDGGRASSYTYQEGVLTLQPAGALVLGNTFNFSGLFASNGPLRRSLVIDVSVALTQAAPLQPNVRVGLGYTVTWY